MDLVRLISKSELPRYISSVVGQKKRAILVGGSLVKIIKVILWEERVKVRYSVLIKLIISYFNFLKIIIKIILLSNI